MTDFCVTKGKKLMMKGPDIMNNKGLFAMRAENSRSRTLFQALTLSFLCFANPVQAQPGAVNYGIYRGPGALPLYGPAFQSMTNLYKGTRFDEKGGLPTGYPSIAIATPALTTKGGAFAIAKPVEDGDGEKPRFCKTWEICPHYIVEKTANGMTVLGVIDAARIDLDDKVENGMYRLKVYKNEEAKSFDLYTYSKDTNGYILTPIPLEKPRADLKAP